MDELASDDEDAKKIKKAEGRAAQKSKERLALRNKRKATVTANQIHSYRYNFDPFRTSSRVPINFFRHNNATEPATASAIAVANQDIGQSSVRSNQSEVSFPFRSLSGKDDQINFSQGKRSSNHLSSFQILLSLVTKFLSTRHLFLSSL